MVMDMDMDMDVDVDVDMDILTYSETRDQIKNSLFIKTLFKSILMYLVPRQLCTFSFFSIALTFSSEIVYPFPRVFRNYMITSV